MFSNSDQGINRDNVGELRLYQAIIVNTIEEWMSGPLRKSREAEQYLFQDKVDFPEICRRAGMDVVQLRAKLSKMSRKVVPAFQFEAIESIEERHEMAA